jgi:uncharacterized protein (DUF1501 family)
MKSDQDRTSRIRRRAFPGGALGLGLAAGSAAVWRGASAGPRPARRLALVFASGGWDSTYAVDPKEPPHSDVPAGAVQRFAGLDVWCDPSRPSVTQLFEEFAAQTAIVRGITMSSIVHNECYKRIATGTTVETNPDFGAIVAHDLGDALPVPYLVLGDVAFTGPYAASAGRIGPSNQLARLLSPEAGALQPTAVEDEAMRRYAQASAERARKTRGATGANRRHVDDFARSIERAARMRELRSRFGTPGDALAFPAQVALAVDALAQDLSQAVMLNPRFAWDTHGANYLQGEYHEKMFAGVLTLARELSRRPGRAAGTTMLDDTVVVVFSEMTRSPRLSSQAPDAGKEHWPVCAAVVIGGGVRGGRVYGGTTPTSEPMRVDLTTGAPSTTGERLTPAAFIGGVLALCGADPAAHLGDGPVLDALRA